MGEYILLTAVLLLSLYGCVELIRSITLRVLKNEKKIPSYLVIPISGNCRNMEFIVRSAVSRSRWMSDFPSKVLLLDAGMDEQTRELAEKICMDFENVHIATQKELDKAFPFNLQ